MFQHAFGRPFLFALLLVLQQGVAHAQAYTVTELTVNDGLSQGFVTAFCQDKRGFMWIGTTNGLNRYDGYRVRVFAGTSEAGWSLGDPSITALETDPSGLLWVGTSEGLYVLEPESARFVKARMLCPDLPAEMISDISCTKDGMLLVSVSADDQPLEGFLLTIPKGLSAAIQSGELQNFHLESKKAPVVPQVISANTNFGSIADILPKVAQTTNMKAPLSRAIYTDRSGNIWMGTKGYGVRILKTNRMPFEHFFPGYSTFNFRQIDDHRIWMGKIHPNDLFNLKKKTIEKAPWNGRLPDKFRLHNTIPDQQGNFWLVGQLDSFSRLVLFRKNTGTCQVFPEQLKNYNYVAEQLFIDRNNNLWVGAHDGICLRYRPGALQPEQFSYRHLLPPSQKGLRSNAMLQTDNGDLFIGTSLGLVRIASPNNTPAFSIYQNDPANPASLSCNAILSLFTDSRSPEILRIGTRGGGLNSFDLATGTCTRFTEEEGLLHNVIYGILSDSAQNLWLSSNRGISLYNPTTGLCNNFEKSDGLAAGEFNTGAALRLANGQLLFGSVDGLVLLDPKAFKLPSSPIPVAVTNVSILGEPAPRAKTRSSSAASPGVWQNLRLQSSQNNLIFEFAGLDFSNPATNRYRYRLRGLDNRWINNGTLRTANYSGLAPGEYTFEVQAATAFGKWPTESARVHILIRAPWYRTWFAYCVYGLLLLLTNLLYIRFRENQIRLQKTAEMARQESFRLRELDAFKNRILANITHEFRTPLTLILGLAERLHLGKNVEIGSISTGILQQGESMLDLLNQMTELSLLRENRIQLNLRQGYISKHIQYFAESLRSLAAEKNIALSIHSAMPDLIMDFDPNRLRQVIVNLLTNAIRYTPSEGAVRIELSCGDENTVMIRVSDTGEGIPSAELPRIFERFYQVSSQKQPGTSGLGLALTKDLVSLMGGNITVESEQSLGSRFTVSLPITRNAVLETNDRFGSYSEMEYKPILNNKATEKQDMLVVVVIEDNRIISNYLVGCLCPNFQVYTAENGDSGIATASEIVPDLVITDISIPGKNGFDVVRILKMQEITSHIPVVILSANDAVNDRIKGRRLGADAFISKPFHEEELLLVLKNLLDVRLLWQQRYTQTNGILSEETAFPPEMQDAVQKEDSFMAKIYAVFEAHYTNESFNLDDLCKALGYSKSKLQRKLANLTNQPPMHLLRNFRLQKAYEMLQNQPDMNVSAVCFRVGFSSTSHFSRLFSKRFNIAPSDVRAGAK